jgi:hypothetical protein
MKFTIRDLLWLTAVVALTVGWWLGHRASERERSVLNTKIERLTPDVTVDRNYKYPDPFAPDE